jgi:ribosome-binding protein aMBF1 (putative translation factor)
MQKHVKTIGDERLTTVPKDLDLKPYRDEQDDDLLRRMLKSVRAGKAPKGIHVQDLAEAIGELRSRVRRHDTPGAHRAAAIKRKKK